jgi:serine/threonine protein kinase
MHAGRGAYGTVYKAQDTSSNEVVAIKIISLTENDLDDLKQIQKEIEYLADCNHPNIVKYLVSLQRPAAPEGAAICCRC